jgi:hypothetical protein
MKLGTLPRGLAVAALAAVTVVPLAASSAAAAPAAPTAYALFGSAQPLVWGNPSSSVPVGNLHVPFVWGKTNNVAVAKAEAKLADPNETVKPLSGEEISGLQCAGFDEKVHPCKDPFKPEALVEHAGPDARHAEKTASFAGKDGKFPGDIQAVIDCGGNCGPQVVRSTGRAAGPSGVLPGYVSIGSSSATHDLSIDDKGRLVSTATSQLDNVSIGPKHEVHFSRLVTTAQAIGAGAANSKDGRADLRISDFYILDNPVELTRAGLRLANGGPSEQEAYDGAKVLLQKLKDRGITLELPNFDAQLTRTPAHVAVDTHGLRVTFGQTVGSVNPSSLTYPLELGHSTAVVAALDAPGRTMDVNENSPGVPTVQNTEVPPAPAPPAAGPTTSPTGPRKNVGTPTTKPATGEGRGVAQPPTSGVKQGSSPAPVTGDAPPVPAPVVSPPTSTVEPEIGTNPDEVALNLRDLERRLGLRDAQSVSRAFGAFLGLGLILPLARFLIRRLG